MTFPFASETPSFLSVRKPFGMGLPFSEISSTLSLPKSYTKQTASKIENLVEYSFWTSSPHARVSSRYT